MYCKYCGAPLEDDVNICPKCQKEQSDPKPAKKEKTKKAGKSKVWALVLCIAGGLVLACVLTLSVLAGMGIDTKAMIGSWFTKKPAQQEQATETCDEVVARIGDRELTNGELQVYYWTHVFDHINAYYYYGMGFDPELPLDEQVYDEASGQTWHDYFLDMAFKTWHRYEVMCIIAEDAGHALSPDAQDYLDSLEEYLAETAETNGFESVDAMIADRFGEGCSYRHYYAFMENYCIGLDFFDMLTADMMPTDQEIDDYYSQHEDEFVEAGAGKDDGYIGSVRHILICPKNEDGSETYTDAQWAAALSDAEALLAQWKAGDATEETFTEFAIAYSEDPGVTSNSGLYENIAKDSGYVAPFEEWAIDPARFVGQTGIVKTDFGYHIMYYVSGGPVWYLSCQEAILTERISAKIDESAEKHPYTTEPDKVVLGNALEGVEF